MLFVPIATTVALRWASKAIDKQFRTVKFCIIEDGDVVFKVLVLSKSLSGVCIMHGR
jgi:hypothetical protein